MLASAVAGVTEVALVAGIKIRLAVADAVVEVCQAVDGVIGLGGQVGKGVAEFQGREVARSTRVREWLAVRPTDRERVNPHWLNRSPARSSPELLPVSIDTQRR